MRIQLKDIHKSFGKVRANAGISLSVPEGGILGVLGENGAGKSTLMKVLSGFIRPDSGSIELDGRAMSFSSPADALRRGIGMLHQDPMDFPPLRAVDNFILGGRGGLFPNRREAARRLRESAAALDFDVDPDSYVDSLTVGERQQLEIVRLLAMGARSLILDEPTTGISRPQKEKLFLTLKKLSAKGMAVVFVSHKLEDVEELCSRVAVLRSGLLVGEAEPPYRTDALVGMMFGKSVSSGVHSLPPPGATVLSLKRVCLEGVRLRMDGVSLDVRGGETIGLAGMEGSGQSVFLSACAGLTRPVGGRIGLREADVTGQTHHRFKRHGVAYLPAARLEKGLIPGLTLSDHFVLSEKSRGLFIDRRKAAELAKERIAAFNIKGHPGSAVEALSGGNQQRMLLALLRVPLSLILLEQPTRGLDIESSAYIWDRLKERCAQGASIVFISSDLDEILRYSDRVLVFFSGRVSPPLPAGALSVEQLGELIGGKGWDRIAGEAAHDEP